MLGHVAHDPHDPAALGGGFTGSGHGHAPRPQHDPSPDRQALAEQITGGSGAENDRAGAGRVIRFAERPALLDPHAHRLEVVCADGAVFDREIAERPIGLALDLDVGAGRVAVERQEIGHGDRLDARQRVELWYDGVDKCESLVRCVVLQRLEVHPDRQLVAYVEPGVVGQRRDQVVDQQPCP